MGDHALIERARAGEGRALRTLYERHVERVFRVAYRMAGEEDLARDLTQDTFIRAFSRLNQFRGECAFSSWIHRICMSVVLNGLESRRRHRRRETDLDGVPEPSVGPAGGLEVDEQARLRKALDALPDAQRTVVILHDLEGFTHQEIAEALEVAEGTSKARLSRARRRLREELADLAPGAERGAARSGDREGSTAEGTHEAGGAGPPEVI